MAALLQHERLILAPDYLVGGALTGEIAGADILGDARKVPPQLRTARFYDVCDEGRRMALMLRLHEIGILTALTPGMDYYRRLYELRDDCFFVNVTLRALGQGADVCVESGMNESRLLPSVRGWMEELRRWGIRFRYRDAEPTMQAEMELVTAKDVEHCFRQGKQELITAANAIITPYAWDEARERNIAICKRV